MNRIANITLGVFISIFLLASCQKEDREILKDPLEEHYKLIDKGDYSLAIEKLEELSLVDPRPQVRVALASAYAARAGVRVENYWGFVVGFKAPLMFVEDLKMGPTMESLQRITGQTNGNVNLRELKSLGGAVNTLAVWDRYQERVEAIPVVKEPGALQDLQRGVEVLSMVQTPGGRLYRGLLNLILFKSHLVASEALWAGLRKVAEQVAVGKLEALCQLKLEELMVWLPLISYHLGEALGDLSVAFPRERVSLEEARDLLQRISRTISEGAQELQRKRICP